MKRLTIILLMFICGCQKVETQDSIHFTFLSLAMHCYADGTGKIPSDITDKDGKPLLSWRVAVLKYGGPVEVELYNKFKLDEPWNSPYNLKVALTVPTMYVDAKGPKCKTTPLKMSNWGTTIDAISYMNPKEMNYTPYLAVTGPNAAFRPGKPRDFDLKDKHAAIVVVDKSDVFWTEPRDISLEKAKKGDSLRRYENRTFYQTAGGFVRVWEKDVVQRANGETNFLPIYEYEPDEQKTAPQSAEKKDKEK